MYDRVADLSLAVDAVEFQRHERDTASGFTRVTTEVVLRGPDAVGRGEDVTYTGPEHDHYDALDPDLAGEYTLASFSDSLSLLELFPDPPEMAASRHYRRWGFESAALDLALRQAGQSLGGALDREYDPLRFVVSRSLADPDTGEASADPVHELLARDPDMEFKLDPTPEWSEDLVAELAATDAVRVVDLKSYYEGTDVDNPADPDLYERVLEGFPEAVVEDARFTDETRELLDANAERLSWDYPITGIESIRELPIAPDWLNVKPSRFGTVESLLETIAFCEERGIRLYGGGQFELGVGRGQIQSLASLLYPDAPNDVAPGGYNDPEPEPGLPTSPLAVSSGSAGFGLH
ncbi:hypothetical protein ACKVMT_11190 [Halobacteriales archaeon Cl-PHB]